jgi:hypothetical protein
MLCETYFKVKLGGPGNRNQLTEHFCQYLPYGQERAKGTWKGAAEERKAMMAAMKAAKPPTTMPWTWMRARLAVPISTVCSTVSRWPRLAWVDSLNQCQIPMSILNYFTLLL